MKIKNILLVTFYFLGIGSICAQTDTILLNKYKQEIIKISKLENDLQLEKMKFSDLSNAYKKDTLILQKQIKDLKAKLSSEEKKVLELNKNNVLEERNKLQNKVDSLNKTISTLNQSITDKDKQIKTEMANAKTSAQNAKNEGKEEILSRIINSYQNKLFDDLIQSYTKESVNRDMQLVGNNPEVKAILNDLLIFFSAKELMSKKLDVIQLKNAQTQLSQIKRQSKLLDEIKEDVDFYVDFYSALKETINKLVILDRDEEVNDPVIQKLKFNKIALILTDYMYNYYDYTKYPYLSNIIPEILKRKKINADADISDLLKL